MASKVPTLITQVPKGQSFHSHTSKHYMHQNMVVYGQNGFATVRKASSIRDTQHDDIGQHSITMTYNHKTSFTTFLDGHSVLRERERERGPANFVQLSSALVCRRARDKKQSLEPKSPHPSKYSTSVVAPHLGRAHLYLNTNFHLEGTKSTLREPNSFLRSHHYPGQSASQLSKFSNHLRCLDKIQSPQAIQIRCSFELDWFSLH